MRDTVSVDCKNVDLSYRLDLRIITDTVKGPIEAATGEFANAEYPRTFAGIRTGGIRKIIDLLGQVEYMMDEIEENMKSYSRNTNNKVKDIISKGKHIRQFEAEA
ncbi:hypothetical protein CU098_013776 [Rhizopus stolonifer]|uniref:Uncharacterized protein n=1 Tax=Rhizopus stolonifer TaxID=4846 RepID=A0A367KWU5_RHIST|nr:hypothetical protein CU098_013776 [Rhizopus stolonifer]